MKYKIEKNTVQETLILPLYSRKLCSELYPNLYRDRKSTRLNSSHLEQSRMPSSA